MKLLLDAGNSRLKWCLHSDGFVDEGVCSYSRLGAQLSRLNAGALTEIIVSTVKGAAFERELVEVCRQVFGLVPAFARVQRQLNGLIAAYTDLSKLGVDRWLAMMAAYQCAQGAVVVIDAGTAVTADFVDSGGNHLGGLIVPGVGLSSNALFHNTGAVQVESLTLPQTWQPGCDTLSCVEQGMSAVYKGLMQEVVSKALNISADVAIYLTGGDSGVFTPWLPATCIVRSGLVFDGLLACALSGGVD